MTIWANAASTRKTFYTLSLLALLVGAAPAHPAFAAGDASGFITDLGSSAAPSNATSSAIAEIW